jgi:hypothetical protein
VPRIRRVTVNAHGMPAPRPGPCASLPWFRRCCPRRRTGSTSTYSCNRRTAVVAGGEYDRRLRTSAVATTLVSAWRSGGRRADIRRRASGFGDPQRSTGDSHNADPSTSQAVEVVKSELAVHCTRYRHRCDTFSATTTWRRIRRPFRSRKCAWWRYS